MKKEAEAEELKKLLAEAKDHPMMKTILADKAAEVLQTRMAAAERIKALRDEQGLILPRLRQTLADAEDELRAYDAGRKPIEEKVRLARLIFMDEGGRLDREISMIEGELLSNYDPAIDAAADYFKDQREALLLKKPDHDTRTGESNLITWKKKITNFSNTTSIANALAYTLAALREIEQMKRAPVADLARIEELKRDIPDTSVMLEYGGSKPLETTPVNPLYAMAARVESTVALTLEKVDALLAKKKRA